MRRAARDGPPRLFTARLALCCFLLVIGCFVIGTMMMMSPLSLNNEQKAEKCAELRLSVFGSFTAFTQQDEETIVIMDVLHPPPETKPYLGGGLLSWNHDATFASSE